VRRRAGRPERRKIYELLRVETTFLAKTQNKQRRKEDKYIFAPLRKMKSVYFVGDAAGFTVTGELVVAGLEAGA